MYTNKLKAILSVITLSTVWHLSANATEFLIDEFTVERNGNVLFQDTFDNGDPNDTGWVFNNGNTATYSSIPSPLNGPESNGKLAMDPFAGTIINSGLTGEPIHISRARLNTNTSNNTANLHRGLKVDDTISVSGLFDIITPSNIGERFGVRLTDRGDINGNSNDVVEVDMQLRNSGLVLELREQDVMNSTNIILDTINFTAAALGLTDAEFALFDQVRLILNRAGPGADVMGAFELIDIDGLIADFEHDFLGGSTIFEGELFTRAEFISVAKIAVPEPQTFMLMLVGLSLFVFGRKKSVSQKY